VKIRQSLASTVLAVLGVGAHAATYTWQGDTNANFTDGANWVENSWSQWEEYVFNNNVVSGSITPDLFHGWGHLHLNSGLTQDIVIGSGQPVIMSSAWYPGVSGTINIAADSRDLTINTSYYSTSGLIWNVGSGRTLTLNGALQDWNGTASLTKQGSGTAVLAGGNTYAGQTDIQAGTLLATSNTALGVGGHNGGTMTFIQDGATLALQGGISLDEHFHVWGSGVGGLGAVRSISGNNALTNAPSGQAGYALRSNTTVGVDAGTLTMSGFYQEAGTWGLIKIGAGTLSLTAPNTFTGGTTINAGVVNIAAQSSMQNSPVVVNSGAVLQTSVDWGTGWDNGAGMGAITVNAGGTLRTSAVANAIRNGLNLNGGTVEATGGTNFNWGQYVLESTMTVGGSSTSTITADFRFRDTSTVNVGVTGDPSGVDLLMSGKVGHANNVAWGYMNKTGAGTLKITGQNEIGGINLSAGKLILEDAGADWAVNSTGLNNNAQVEVSVPSGARTLQVGIYGGGSLVKTGAGTLTLTAVNSYSGGTTVNAGTLVLQAFSGQARAAGALTVNAGATVETTGDGTGLGFYDQLTTLNVNGGTATSAGVMHVWNLTGGVNLTGGTLQSNSGVSTASGAQLEWNRTSVTTLASATTSTIGGRINIRGDNGYTTVDLTVADGAAATDLAVTAAITEAAGGRGIAKHGPGTMVLSGNNSYTGATTVNDGLVIVQNGNGIGNLSNVTLNNASQLRLDANESVGSLSGSASSTVNIQGNTLQLGDPVGNATATYDGVISGTGALVRRGGGTQTLTGNNTFSGSVTVQDGGTLSVPTVSASGPQPLGTGTGNIGLDGSGGGATLAITGAGTYNLPSTRGLSLSGSGGILNVTAGTVNMAGDITGASNSAHFTKSGAGTFNFSGTGSWSGNFTVSGGTFNLTGGGSIPGVGVTTVSGTLNINSSGTFNAASIDILPGGAVNFDAGTLRVGGGGLNPTGRSIDNTSGSFNWGNSTLTVYTTGSGEAGATDRTGIGGSPSGPAVKEGNYLSVAGDLNAPSGSTLDLGSTYLSNGLRYNQLNVDGNLTLNDGTLNIGLSPYFLRPNTPDSVTVGDWGTMVLVYAEGTLSGTFAQLAGKTVIPGISNDGIGWTQLTDIEYTGGPTFDPSLLGLNEWVIEYRDGSGGNDFNFTQSPGAVVLLHYKVAGSVPEPASAGLLIAGALLLRALRRRG
jgi:fibronectin-binding autotransporter adhesin